MSQNIFCFFSSVLERSQCHKMYYMSMDVYTSVPLILPLKFKVPQSSVGLKCLNYGDAPAIFKDLVWVVATVQFPVLFHCCFRPTELTYK